MSKSNVSRGFTLLEILLVVAIISILAGIVIVAINPAKQLGDARNAQRRADVATILSAVYQYVIDNNGTIPPYINNVSSASGGLTDGYVSASSTCSALMGITVLTASTTQICKSTATAGACPLQTGAAAGTNLTSLTSGTVSYITGIPTDPSVDATIVGSGYYIARMTSANNRILVCAPLTENQTASGGMIGVSR